MTRTDRPDHVVDSLDTAEAVHDVYSDDVQLKTLDTQLHYIPDHTLLVLRPYAYTLCVKSRLALPRNTASIYPSR